MLVTTDVSIEQLEKTARKLRRHIVKMLAIAGSGHPGGSLSAIDILTALFFGNIMRYNPRNPRWEERDRFILSKGHAVPALYAVLAEAGFIPEEWLWQLRQIDTPMQGHPSVKDLPAVEASTGSLGQGLSIGLGMALAARLDNKTYRVYVMIGDGESEEGQIWEAAMAASHFRVGNLTAILDYNRYQLDGAIGEIMSIAPVVAKWEAFGWAVREIDGHNMRQILDALHWARAPREQPSIIVAHTVKGKGVSFMENNNEFHGKAPTQAELEQALAELAD
ncbi:MAG: transketolase [Armatimonadota bacterium]|nr:transketolase [bacterium]MDW8320840.1 transketolase [Armatimonadota bacterium]